MSKMEKNSSWDKEPSLSLGEKIKRARLILNLSYEQVFAKTKISENFVNALEKEEWSKLPAYAFSIGLLKNLLEIYNLKPEIQENIIKEFTAIIKNEELSKEEKAISKEENSDLSSQTNKITFFSLSSLFSSSSLKNSLPVIKRLPGDEAPYSEEKQLQKKISSSIWTSLIILLLFLLVALLFFYFEDVNFFLGNHTATPYRGDTTQTDDSDKNLSKKNRSKGVYSLYSQFNTFDIVKDDVVKVFFKNHILNFRLSGIMNNFDNKISVNFDFNNEKLIKVYLFEEFWLDIDQDGWKDLLIKFQKISGEVAIVFFSLVNKDLKNVNFESIWNNQKKVLIKKGETVLLKDQNKAPIQLYLKATTLPVHLTYNIDGQRQNTINLRPGNTVTLLAYDHLELQVGNFRSVILVLNFIPLIFKTENPNQFGITKIIKWLSSYHNETKYDLIVKDYIQ